MGWLCRTAKCSRLWQLYTPNDLVTSLYLTLEYYIHLGSHVSQDAIGYIFSPSLSLHYLEAAFPTEFTGRPHRESGESLPPADFPRVWGYTLG